MRYTIVMDDTFQPPQPISDTEHARRVIQQLREAADPHVNDIVERLAFLGDQAVNPLIEAVKAHSNVYGDRHASRVKQALIRAGEPAVAALLEALQGAHRPFWDHLVDCLAHIGTPTAITALIDHVRTLSEDDSIQFLDEHGFEITAVDEQPHHIGLQGSQWEILETAITNIGPDALLYLRPFLNDPDRRLRHFVVSVLTWVGDQHGSMYVIEDLLPHLHDRDPVVRTATAYGLNLFDDERAMPGWVAALHDPHPDVRWFAAGKLGTFQDVRLLDVLLRVRENEAESRAVRDAAARSIDEIQNNNA